MGDSDEDEEKKSKKEEEETEKKGEEDNVEEVAQTEAESYKIKVDIGYAGFPGFFFCQKQKKEEEKEKEQGQILGTIDAPSLAVA